MLLRRAEDRWRLTGRAEGFAREAVDEGRPLRYGYPAVLFDPERSERSRGRSQTRPVFVMDEDGLAEPETVAGELIGG
ncbi:hypothetical protein [Nocardiopsis sp. SBT366]|uniref:hypothetical protein n=1 Tax=Nocardiopsis sp. SBT366 TaxID=1580529 RepID=UPI00066E89D3|nr:hypothetical protein [Nocardiopsis sp. SBT366]